MQTQKNTPSPPFGFCSLPSLAHVRDRLKSYGFWKKAKVDKVFGDIHDAVVHTTLVQSGFRVLG